MSEIVLIAGVKCLGCGHELSAREFTDDSGFSLSDDYPVPVTVSLARAPLWHPPGVGWIDADGTITEGCGGTLALTQQPAPTGGQP